MSKPISFSVPDEDRAEIQRYAEVKGYKDASAFARFSTYAQMRKNPLTSAELARIERKYGHTVENPAAQQQQQPGANKEDE